MHSVCMHNTGANLIANGLDWAIEIIDGEDPGRRITIPSHDVGDWQGTIFPWVDNDQEGREKSFKATSLGDGQRDYTIFQRYNNDLLRYHNDRQDPVNTNSPYLHSEPMWDSMTGNGYLGKHSYVDILIMPGRIWGVAATNDVGKIRQLLQESLALL